MLRPPPPPMFAMHVYTVTSEWGSYELLLGAILGVAFRPQNMYKRGAVDFAKGSLAVNPGRGVLRARCSGYAVLWPVVLPLDKPVSKT